MITIKQTLYTGCLFSLFSSCSSNTGNEPSDTRENGTIYISADESFKPVIDSQIKVYESSYPQTHIIVHYKPEAECLRDFGVDSIRMIIATRGYSESEKIFMEDSMKVIPKQLVIAYDAVAVIVNKQSTDTLLSMAEIKEILTGRYKKNLTPVFDGLHATSTIRFIIDSVLRNDQLSPKAQAAES
ncbi:MAG: substrate-binding domain-containing protein, partial [Bacteroidota bacterium]|nr:substrate-binding domain-containing protein [Bacteroidota bacterium]